MKACSNCKEVKPAFEFHKNANYCKKCARAYMRQWRKNGGPAVEAADLRSLAHKKRARIEKPIALKRKSFENMIKHHFGLSVEDFARMAHEQNLACAICRNKLLFDSLTHVDHCHKTGKVRALLCHKCNILIGMADDRLSVLESAIRYLTRFDSRG